MNTLLVRRLPRALVVLGVLACAACAANRGAYEAEPTLAPAAAPVAASAEITAAAPEDTQAKTSKDEEGEVPIAVAETEHPQPAPPSDKIPEILVQGNRDRHEVIRDLVAEAQALLRDVELQYFFTGTGKREVLRGRPVAFALWSDRKKEWSIVHVELPRPPIKWKPGGRPLPFVIRTPGVQARHVKGTGAERLMFAFTRDGETLNVYGRKFPVFDNALLKKKDWRGVASTAKPIVYLPFTEDTFDPTFVSGGRDFLLATAHRALDEMRAANEPSAAFPGELIADVIPAEVVTTLAVIEQTDDMDYVGKGGEAFDEVLSQYGLKREEAYRYSVSSASALGPMQFTNRKNKGTYAFVVRRCPGAKIDPDFNRGATNLLNAMKAAICLLDLDLASMSSDIRLAYRANRSVLGIFPVAAYNGGQRNVIKLSRVLTRMKVRLDELRSPTEETEKASATCPCIWKQDATGVRAMSIPKYNNENRWYIEKYQSIVSLFQ